MQAKDWFTLFQAVSRAFSPLYQTQMREVLQEVGFQGRDSFIIMQALAHEPNPLTPELTRFPYTNITMRRQNLEEVVEHGYLEKIAENHYQVNKCGREAVHKVFTTAHHYIGIAKPLPDNELTLLHELLKKIIRSTLDADSIKSKRHIQTSHTVAPSDDSPNLAHIDQYITDLILYRDDAHENAWQVHDIAGHDWEVFSFIWEGHADSLESLINQEDLRFERRGFTPEDYQQSLDRLVERGWLSNTDKTYAVTKEGQDIRKTAEVQTDDYFLIGWSSLDAEEIAQLKNLLQKLQQALEN